MHTYKYNVCIDFRDQTDRSETCFFSHTHFTTELWNQCYGRICMEEWRRCICLDFPHSISCLNLMYWHEPLVLKLPLPPPSLASLHPKAPAKGRFPPALAPLQGLWELKSIWNQLPLGDDNSLQDSLGMKDSRGIDSRLPGVLNRPSPTPTPLLSLRSRSFVPGHFLFSLSSFSPAKSLPSFFMAEIKACDMMASRNALH